MRLRWIDGLKGIASILIVLHHFILAFIPALYYGSSVQYNLYRYEGLLADSPLLFLFGGHFLVNLFLLLSGLVLSLQVYQTNTIQELFINLIKRYLRLALPVFVISLIVYFMLRFGLLYNNQLANNTGSPWLTFYYKAPLSLKSVFETSFYTVWFVGNDAYSTAFWMLTHLFYGSLLTYVTIFTFRKLHKFLQLFLIVLVIGLSVYYKSYLINFGFGMFLAWSIQNYQVKDKKMLGTLFIILGLIFAGYPQGVTPTNLYRLFTSGNFDISFNLLIHSTAALFIVLGLFFSRVGFYLFNHRISQFLGRISYAVYLTHIPILFSITSLVFIALRDFNLSYLICLIVTLFTYISFVVILSELYQRFVIDNINKSIKHIFLIRSK